MIEVLNVLGARTVAFDPKGFQRAWTVHPA